MPFLSFVEFYDFEARKAKSKTGIQPPASVTLPSDNNWSLADLVDVGVSGNLTQSCFRWLGECCGRQQGHARHVAREERERTSVQEAGTRVVTPGRPTVPFDTFKGAEYKLSTLIRRGSRTASVFVPSCEMLKSAKCDL